MKTTIYLCRDSEISFKIIDEKKIQEFSKREDISKLDVLYSSPCVSSIRTAKYLASNNNININIDERFADRVFGVELKDLPYNFNELQFANRSYKMSNGESLNEVKKRITEAIKEILIKDKGKTVLVISHETAIASYLFNWCIVYSIGEDLIIEYNGETIIDGGIKPLELFELVFEDDILVHFELKS